MSVLIGVVVVQFHQILLVVMQRLVSNSNIVGINNLHTVSFLAVLLFGSWNIKYHAWENAFAAIYESWTVESELFSSNNDTLFLSFLLLAFTVTFAIVFGLAAYFFKLVCIYNHFFSQIVYFLVFLQHLIEVLQHFYTNILISFNTVEVLTILLDTLIINLDIFVQTCFKGIAVR
jgi:hypothetical protein